MSDMQSSSIGVCTSPACIHAASDILSALATNYEEIDPCTDFAEYTCGNWGATHEIPAGQTRLDVLSATKNQIDYTVRLIIEGDYPTGQDAGWITVNLTEPQRASDRQNFAKLQTAYQTCLNASTNGDADLASLRAFVQEVVDAFPATLGGNNSNGTTEDLAGAMGNTLTLFETYGIATVQSIAHKQNNANPDETHIAVLLPQLERPPMDEQTSETYAQLASQLISAFHPANITVRHAGRLFAAVLAFEEQIATFAQLSTAETGEAFFDNPLDSLTPRTLLSEVQDNFPELNLDQVISELALESYQVDLINAPSLSYFANLTQLLTHTPAEVLQTFFVWRAILTLSPYVDSEVTSGWNMFYAALQGIQPETPVPTWSKCLNLLEMGPQWIQDSAFATYIGPAGLTWIIARFFADQNYTPQVADLTSRIVDYLAEAFEERIQNADWLTPEVKESAVEKIRAMTFKIGLPTDPNAVDPIAMEEFYADAQINTAHLDNVLSLAKFTFGKRWAELAEPFARGQFRVSTLGTSAYQDFQLNAAGLLAGIQQSPLYDIDLPSYILYGGMGSVVGHEITHGFDHFGSSFDASGNLTGWWDESSTANFDERTQCFVDQYSNFNVTAANGTGVPIDGTRTLGENVADAGGVAASFLAWRRWEEVEGRSQSLPGLDEFTHEQLFFIKWGQFWCRNSPPAVDVEHVLTERHSPHDARIMLTLENQAEFKRAFHCPGPREPTCELW